MGSIASKEFEDTLGNVASPDTPKSKDVHEIDPRSPTIGITRTPIHVLATPECLDDPRSPSLTINRTPVVVKDIKNDPCKNQVDALKTQILFTNLDLQESPESQTADVEISDVCSATAVSEHDDILNDKPQVEGTCKKEAKKDNDKKDVPKTIEKKTGKINSTLRLGERSPLSTRNIDYNSPRAIVQRKQSGKLAIKTTSLQLNSTNATSKYKILQEDKENM